MNEQKTDDAAALRAEITETRAKLGDTVEALTHKLDFASRSKAKAQQIREATLERTDALVTKLPEPMAAPTRRGVGVAVAHPAIAAGAAVGTVLLVRGVVKWSKQ